MSLANSVLNGGSNSYGGGRGGRGGDKSLGRDGAGSHPFRSLTPRRVAIIAGGLLFMIFYFGKSTGIRSPSSSDGSSPPSVPHHLDELDGSKPSSPNAPPDIIAALPPASPQNQASSSKVCTPPPGKKAKSYALMIDAGSTGSRLHLYTFSHCNPSPSALPKLESEGFYTTVPGLSSYAGRPKDAAESLKGLMESAMMGVPEAERACTPVALKATAGLRLLGKKESDNILAEVERWLNGWPFSLVDNGVVIMDGRDEGVYAWITINFLLGLIGPSTADPASTAAIMDLGGASTQIVFEPTFADKKDLTDPGLLPGSHVYDLTFAGTDHVLYQHSHLGYGLMQARRAVNNLVAFNNIWSSSTSATPVAWESLDARTTMHHPCMFKNTTKVVQLDPPGRLKKEVTMVGTGSGFEACRRVVEVMLSKDGKCDSPPCAFGGVYQPKLEEVFRSGKVWALSYFYDRLHPLGLPSPFTISSLRTLASDVCAGPDSPSWSRFDGNDVALKELAGRPESCLDLTFCWSLLSLGYELEGTREVWMGKQVGGVELGWALGAGIAMLDGHLSCRAD